jgi:hypothetical protein
LLIRNLTYVNHESKPLTPKFPQSITVLVRVPIICSVAASAIFYHCGYMCTVIVIWYVPHGPMLINLDISVILYLWNASYCFFVPCRTIVRGKTCKT